MAENAVSAVLAVTCTCGSIGAEGFRFCPDHHMYWNGDAELASVTRVLLETWPLKPDFAAADPHTLEHARERGIRVDRYISEYLRSGRLRIPAGEWEEVVVLVQGFCRWWDRGVLNGAAQVTLYDGEIAGTCDILDFMTASIFDVKCTYAIEATYPLQLGAYADLHEARIGKLPNVLGLIHLHKRFTEPHLIHYDVVECVENWRTLRKMWRLVRDLAAQKR